MIHNPTKANKIISNPKEIPKKRIKKNSNPRSPVSSFESLIKVIFCKMLDKSIGIY